MKTLSTAVAFLAATSAALAQDQQLGARTKAMGGSYTAFEDDPVSVWLNPAGISTQTDSLSIAYQTYVTYPLHRSQASGSTQETFSAGAETTFVDPAFVPSYLGVVFQVGTEDDPMAVGICYARPYVLNYSFDQVSDPAQTVFTPDSNVDQQFSRFRFAFSKDFRFSPRGQTGWFTHLSAAIGLDIGYQRWEFKSADTNVSDNSTAYGGGLGLLLGVYDDTESLRVNFGLAWQSAMKWDYNIDPDIYPAFDMPQQVNFGIAVYLLPKFALRATIDFQWIQWSDTADVPLYPGKETFEDAQNFSLGLEYRIPVNERLSVYPRAGYRRFDAPWGDENNLPSTSDFQLVLDTKGEAFNLFTFGVGLGWSNEGGKARSVDLGADVGGDSYSLALGFNYEF